MRKTVIFDLDGVIFDSEQVVRQGWRYAAERLHLGRVDHLFLQCVGTNHIFTERLLQEQFGPRFSVNTPENFSTIIPINMACLSNQVCGI